MEKIALVTDSASDITRDMVEKYNITVLPFRIIMDGHDYRDGVDINSQEVYDSLDKYSITSSLTSMDDMTKMFEKLKEEGYTHVIAVTISSKLSGMNNALRLVSNDYPEIITEVIDSKSISCMESAMIQHAGKLIEEGKCFEDVVKIVKETREKSETFFIIGTLEYLKKGGRIGKVAGTIAEILNIKPIIRVSEEGEYTTYDKVRGRKQSINRMIEIASKILDRGKYDVYVGHGCAEEESKKMLEEISKNKNINRTYFKGLISGVAGVHSGPGLIGIVFYGVN